MTHPHKTTNLTFEEFIEYISKNDLKYFTFQSNFTTNKQQLK
jgi:hypothetical protein